MKQIDVKNAREDFINGRPVKTGVVRPEILESWKRSRRSGVIPGKTLLADTLTREQVSTLLAENHLLISCARKILKNFYQMIRNDDIAIMVLDRGLHLLEIVGDGARWKKHNIAANIKIGTCLQEKCVGTTPGALALKYDRPFEISGYEYFSQIWHDIRDFSVPIHHEDGRIIGTLELAVNRESTLNYSHTFALAVAIAGIIENQLQLMNSIERNEFFSGSLAASMASLEEGLIVLGMDHEIVHVNPYIEKMLGVKLKDVKNQTARRLIRNTVILKAIENKLPFVDREIVLDESVGRHRYLVSVNQIISSSGRNIGQTLVFKEFKSIQALIHRVAGPRAHYSFEDILGESPEIKNVIRIAKKVAKSTSNILIVGESGTGKEIVAQSIHNMSIGSAGPFMAINCAAFPSEMIESEFFGYEPGTFTGGLQQGKPGKLELANGGTLFLDELNSMSLDMQVKLLRVLEEKQFQRLGGHRYITLNARIIGATNQDLQERVTLGHFRSDLYYRLAVVEIQIPPLRMRRQDIAIYVRSFIQEMNRRLCRSIKTCSKDAMDYLMNYTWPGNVRELKNWIERAVNLAESNILTPEDFPLPAGGETGLCNYRRASGDAGKNELAVSVGLAEKEKIRNALGKYPQSKELVCRHLGIGRATLYRKIKKYGLGEIKSV